MFNIWWFPKDVSGVTRLGNFNDYGLFKIEDVFIAEQVHRTRKMVEMVVIVSLVIRPPGDLRDIKIAGQGCSISQSSGSLMSAAVKGRPLDEVEKRHILKTLEHTDWNKSQAATILSIERSTLDRKIKTYSLKR